MKIPKRLLSLTLALFMLLSLLFVTAVPVQAAELGTLDNPIRISTEAQLKNIKYGLDKHYVLTADITLTENWTPIGPSDNKAFTGSFDGNWHTIRNLTITTTGSGNFGLFGSIGSGAEIHNLQLTDIDIDITTTSGSSYTGGLVGYALGGSIENCVVQGALSGRTVGGLAGAVVGGIVNQCFTDVDVTNEPGSIGAGGLVGSLSGLEGRIRNSFAVGRVGGNYAGGLVGIVSDNASVKYSYSTGAVSGSHVGGLVGMNVTGGQVTDSYYDTETTGQTYSPGGTGKSTAEMQTATPFTDWDTGIWSFEEGKYPALYYQCEQYSVTYDSNGGGAAPVDSDTYCGFESVTAASSAGLTPPEGKAFKEWNTAEDGSGIGYAPSQTVGMPPSDLTLYAIWDMPYTVSYDLNTGSGAVPSTEQHFAGDSFDAASGTGTTAPEDKRFLEWNTAADGFGDSYASGDTVTMPAGDLILYAIWESSYVFTYDLNGSEGDAPAGGLYFEDDTFLAVDDTGITAPDSKQFKEWNTSSDGAGERYAPGDTVTMPAANLTLYAIWEELQDGSEEYPFLVNDYYDLYAVKDGLDFHYRQTADITLPDPDFAWEEFDDLPDDSNWAPLGNGADPFTGSYDGGGFTISNLIINTNAFRYAGLFGYVADGTELKNITLSDVEITSSNLPKKGPAYVGSLVGYNEGIIRDCTANAYLSGGSGSAVGGITGYNEGMITACAANAYLSAGSDSVVGGIAGYNEGTITDCAANGCSAAGSNSVVGGITGYNEGMITACAANGCLAVGKDSFVEGIAGLKDGTITDCIDNTTRAQAETLFFIEEEGKFYIGAPEDEIEASDLDEGCWTYDGESGILTLDNFTWVTLAPQALVIVPDVDDDLTIYLAPESENTFISLFYGRNNNSSGVEVTRSLTIDGTGTLTVQSGLSKDAFIDGICVFGDLLIKGGTINAMGNVAAADCLSSGIYADNEVIISGGTVTATGGTQAVLTWDDPAAMTVNIAGGYRYWTNTTASVAGAAGPVNSTTTPFINSDAYKYICIVPGLEKEPTPTSPTPAAYNANVSDGGKVPVTVNIGTGNASLNLSSLSERLADGGNTVVTVPPIPGVSSYTASFPSTAISGRGAGSLTLSTGAGSVTIPDNMLFGTGLAGSASITIGAADTSGLPKSVQRAIGNRPLISIALTMNGRPVEWSNPGAPVRVSIPYTPTAEELLNPESIVIWYIDGSGNAVTIPNGHYDPQAGAVTFSTTHFSQFAVAYKRLSFNDVAADAWYNKAVSFLAAREITTGTGNGNYSPEAELTRGDFMVLLMRAYGISPDLSPGENFADAGDTYYTGYLKAAKTLGISEGVGNNLFAPGKEITRQEMFVLLYNALQLIGQTPQGKSDETLGHFTDAGSIDSWAKEALMLLVETGVVRGSNGALRPLNTTTRAEMAQMLYNIL